MTEQANTLWIRGYTREGFQLSLTLAVDPANVAADVARLLAEIAAAGILPREQGTEPGEKTETFSHAVLRKYTGQKDNKPKTVLDLYVNRENFANRRSYVYINSADDAQAFELASGLQLGDMPVHPMRMPLSRDEAETLKVLVAFPIPAVGVMKPNPDYNPNGATAIERGAEYKFDRWQLSAVPKSAPTAPPKSTPQPPAQQGDPLALDALFGDRTDPHARTFMDSKDFSAWCKTMRGKYNVPDEITMGTVLDVVNASDHKGGKAKAEAQVKAFMAQRGTA